MSSHELVGWTPFINFGQVSFPVHFRQPFMYKRIYDLRIEEVYSALAKTTRKELMAVVCLADVAVMAKEKLDANAYSYFASGADEERTLKDNENSFRKYRLRPRFLRDVSCVVTTTRVLGEEISFPVCVSPTAMQRMAHHEGELATSRACARAGTCMVLSSWSTVSMEEVAKASAGGLRWFQIDIFKDKSLRRRLIQRAESAGFSALVVPIDSPVLGRRLEVIRVGFKLPQHLKLAHFPSDQESGMTHFMSHMFNSSLNWEDIRWLQSASRLPIVLKGVLTAEDAKMAAMHGVDGIMVSNHGGRQLDGVPATIDVLKEVVDAVDGRCEVYMDGGVRQGTDVLKALALGARAVFIGRPVVWGLAYNGQKGVEEVLQILRDEFERAMALSGCASLLSIRPELVVKESVLTSRL